VKFLVARNFSQGPVGKVGARLCVFDGALSYIGAFSKSPGTWFRFSSGGKLVLLCLTDNLYLKGIDHIEQCISWYHILLMFALCIYMKLLIVIHSCQLLPSYSMFVGSLQRPQAKGANIICRKIGTPGSILIYSLSCRLLWRLESFQFFICMTAKLLTKTAFP